MSNKKLKVMVVYSSDEIKKHDTFSLASNTAIFRELAKQGTNAVLILSSLRILNSQITERKDKNIQNNIEQLVQLGFVQKLVVTSATNADSLDHATNFIKTMARLYDQIASSSFLTQFYPNNNNNNGNDDTQVCETTSSTSEIPESEKITDDELHRLQSYEDNSVSDGIKNHFTFKLWSYKVPQS